MSFVLYLDDVSLCWFLRGCKFDVNRTKARIETFFVFRSKVVEWYADRDPLLPELLEILNLGYCLPNYLFVGFYLYFSMFPSN